ncbi:sugar phosphate isomerase/epimerase [bacterium]|nr:sugar phosphate isomerase/epimerase [bacterium]
MIKAISLRCFPSSWTWKECIEKAKEYEFEGVEINFDGRIEIDCSPDTLKEIKKRIKENNLKVVSVYSRHQWKTPISSEDKEKREKGKKLLERLVEIAEFLECNSVLTIPGMVDNSLLSDDIEIVSYDSVYKRAKEIIYEVSIFAKEKGVTLSIENVPNKFLLSPLEMKNFIEEIGTEAVGCH